MSLATLKRKNATGKNLSSNKIFSTKGIIRNIKGIGNNNQINSDVRTIFKGSMPSGCGSHSSTQEGSVPEKDFPVYIIGNCNHETVRGSVPTSTMTTKGLLSSRAYRPTASSECENGCKKIWVKNYNPLDYSQSEYMRMLNVKKSADPDIKIDPVYKAPTECHNYKIGSRKTVKNTYNKNAKTGAMSSRTYTNINLLRNKCLPTPKFKSAFPFMNNGTGCNSDFLTPEEAINAGILPENWMKQYSECPTYKVFTINPFIDSN